MHEENLENVFDIASPSIKRQKKGIKRPNIKKQLKALKTVKRFYDNKIIASEQCKDHWL